MVSEFTMGHNMKSLPLFALAAALLAGCASVDYRGEQAAIFADAAERTSVAPADEAELQALLGEPLTEDRTVALALARNRGLRARLAEAGLARADWIEAGSLPGIAAELNVIPQDGSDVIDLDLTAPLLGLIALPAYRAQARDRYDAARAGALLAVIDFTADTRIAYVEAVAARQRAELADTVEQAVNAALTAAQELHAAGNIPQVDLDRNRVQALRTRLDAQNARLAAGMAETALRARLGLSDETGLDLPTRLPEPQNADPQADPERIVDISLPLEAARARAGAAGTAARLSNIESLIGHAEAGLILEREDGDWTDGWLLEGEIPLFTLGHPQRASARIRAAAALDHLAQLSLDTRAAAAMQVREAATAAEQAVFVRDTLLPASQTALDGVMAEYNAMQIGVFDLIGAFETHIAAGSAYVDALERHHTARIRLDQLRAGGSATRPTIETGIAGPSTGGEEAH